MSLRKRDLILLSALFCSVIFSLHVVSQVNSRRQADKEFSPAIGAGARVEPGEKQVSFISGNAPAAVQSDSFETKLELIGTMIGINPMAFIYDPAVERSHLYRVNDCIGDIKVAQIFSGKVILERNGAQRELYLSSRKGVSVAGARKGVSRDETGKVIICKSEMMNQVLQAKDLLAKVKILPQPDEAAVNRLKGFRIDNVPSGSIIEEAGIKNGDIICSIQGRQLSSLQEAWSMFNKVQDQNHVEIVLLRDNQPVTLNYEIEK
ncbi:MAG TPA: PDZ domain-containing protein [Candidatus Omnitrophota bacterium]|nr:PDZ domain-containing protein [Candidatus Omnitrophota bacterium]